ncbi:hypothetical protein BX600DRAFT_525261 [Xylariales sp. PMI_506]|nr:hypothetical protein BX600DRAFT_525261 [Xylariales sp. PMI_506]
MEISDLGKQVLAVVWSLPAASGLILGVRLFCKMSRNRGLWWDDGFLISSWLFLVISSATTTAEVKLGFGSHLSEIPPANLSQLGLLGQVTAFISILAALNSKTSFAITILRVTSGQTSSVWMKVAVWIIIVSMNFFMLLSALFVWIQCTPVTKIWDRTLPGTCWNENVVPIYNTFSGVYSGIMDICLAMLPWAIIWNLQMTTKEKLGVAIAMSMGLFAGATGFVKSAFVMRLASNDFTFDGVPLVIWGEAETATTIIAASIPVLRVLLKDIKQSSSRYYGSNPKSLPANPLSSVNNKSVVRTRTHSKSQDDFNDAESSKSILHGATQIVKTSDVRVSYGGATKDPERGYEMGRFKTSAH